MDTMAAKVIINKENFASDWRHTEDKDEEKFGREKRKKVEETNS